ncbi:hypothetical protein EU545_05235, partial [Candidatus Thorarchaeota archaeon]
MYCPIEDSRFQQDLRNSHLLREPDIDKLAVESRQKLVQEFADTYANFRERVKRVPDKDARRISEELSCPLEVAMIAYLIEMDGIKGIREAVGMLAEELQRRAAVGEAVPNLPGNVMEFALVEGRWISHINGPFIRKLELQTRELANEEESVGQDEMEVEKALSIIAARTKLAETYIAPTLKEWVREHPESTTEDVLMTFGRAITKWNQSTLKGKFKQMQRRCTAFFRMLREILTTASDSFTIDASIGRVDSLIAELESPFDEMSLRAASHFLLHMTPRPVSTRGDRSHYVDIGVRSTRGNKAEPDLTSPFDFLERDVKLGARRHGEERQEYLKERIGRVVRVLKYGGDTAIDCVEKSLTELKDRFDLEDLPLESVLEEKRDAIIGAPISERDSLAVSLI